MAMSRVDTFEAMAEEAEGAAHVSTSALSAIARSEVECQLDAAHKYKRSISKFLADAQTMATLTTEVAESCMYSLPRGGKMITGPSVRLAEICASAYGNLQVAARVLDAEATEIIAQGAAWDMERNVRVTIEARRRITDKKGVRFADDMIVVTGNAAASIALRNAIFRVVPRAYVDVIYEKARSVAVGDAKTLSVRRAQVVERLNKMGVSTERVLTRIGKAGLDEIGLEELEVLIGLGTAVKEGAQRLDEAFPEVSAPAPAPAPPAEDGRRIKMRGGKKDDAPAPAPAPPPEPPADTFDPTTGELREDPPLPREPGAGGGQ